MHLDMKKTSPLYKRRFAEFQAAARELGLNASDANIHAAVMQALEARKNTWKVCEACGCRKHYPTQEFCSTCARLAHEEDQWQAKNKVKSPSPAEVTKAWKARERRLCRKDCHDLYMLFEKSRLPKGGKVVSVSATEVQIRTSQPNILWKLDTSEIAAMDAGQTAPTAKPTKKGFGARTRKQVVKAA